MKIESGCTAIIVDGKGSKSNVGTIVSVGNFLGAIKGFRGDNNWEIDRFILFTDGSYHNIIQESLLSRIDGKEQLTRQCSRSMGN